MRVRWYEYQVAKFPSSSLSVRSSAVEPGFPMLGVAKVQLRQPYPDALLVHPAPATPLADLIAETVSVTPLNSPGIVHHRIRVSGAYTVTKKGSSRWSVMTHTWPLPDPVRSHSSLFRSGACPFST